MGRPICTAMYHACHQASQQEHGIPGLESRLSSADVQERAAVSWQVDLNSMTTPLEGSGMQAGAQRIGTAGGAHVLGKTMHAQAKAP